jgi:HEAT repeat protein
MNSQAHEPLLIVNGVSRTGLQRQSRLRPSLLFVLSASVVTALFIAFVFTYPGHQIVPIETGTLGNLSSAEPGRLESNSPSPAELGESIAERVLSAIFPGRDRTQKGSESFLLLTAQLLDPLRPLKVRRQAAWKIAKIASDEALAVLQNALLSAPPELAATIAEALGNSAHPGARALISALLRDDNEIVVRGAIRGLATIGDRESAMLLGGILADSRRATAVRTEAALALGEVNQSAANQFLIQFAHTTDDQDMVTAALLALGQRPFDQTRGFFRSFMDAPEVETDMRALALEALGRGTSDAAPFILNYLQADAREIRAAAAWALANLDDPGPISQPLLAQLQREPDSEVRLRIYQALENQPQVDSALLLPFVLNEADTTARVAGFKLLATTLNQANDQTLVKQFDKLVVPRLADLAVSASDVTTRLSSVITLRQADTAESIRVLELIAERSGDPKIVQAARLK